MIIALRAETVPEVIALGETGQGVIARKVTARRVIAVKVTAVKVTARKVIVQISEGLNHGQAGQNHAQTR